MGGSRGAGLEPGRRVDLGRVAGAVGAPPHDIPASMASYRMTRSTRSPDQADEPPEGDAPRRSGHDRVGVSGSQVAASVLASTSAAVVASVFGVAGTVIGAAVVSVVATVGTAAYGLGIRRTKAGLQQLQAVRLGRSDATTGSRAATRPSGGPAVDAGDPPAPTGAAPSPAAEAGATRWWEGFARHRFRLAGGVALVLALSLGAVSLIEVVTDGPLSGGSSGGRTSIGAVLGRDSDDSGGATEGPTPTTAPGGSTEAPSPTPEARSDGSTTTTEGGAGTTTTTERNPTSTTTTAPPATTTTSPPTTTTTTTPPAEPG